MKKRVLILIVLTLNLSVSACKIDKTKILISEVNRFSIDEHMANFSINLFKEATGEDKNSLLSPISTLYALSMTANGAEGDTLKEMERVLGAGSSIKDLNKALYAYKENLSGDDNLKLANSIWVRDDESIKIKESFIKSNADYYGASINKSKFNEKTVENINSWVYKNTDGMINEILDNIPEEAIMCLINAVAFDAEWEKPYESHEVMDAEFLAINNQKQIVAMMNSKENIYIEDEEAIGFIKPYEGDKYSFLAILPKTNINDYIKSLTGEKYLNLINNAEFARVVTGIPKFKFSYDVSMNEALKRLGINKAFDETEADFSNIGNSSRGNIHIDNVLHKTFIDVNELGTKAGAVTAVMLKDMLSLEEPDYYVYLDRPFVFMIIENETKAPIFIGAVREIN